MGALGSFITRIRRNGSPGNWLDLYAAADIPETEMFHPTATSSSPNSRHPPRTFTGKPLVSSETGTWLEEHFAEKLSDVKISWTTCFSPASTTCFITAAATRPTRPGWPGWHFLRLAGDEPRNSIWRDVPRSTPMRALPVHPAIRRARQRHFALWPIEDFWMQPGDSCYRNLPSTPATVRGPAHRQNREGIVG